MIKKNDILNYIFILLGGILLFFIVAPLIGMFLASSKVEITQAITDKEVLNSIWLTIYTSVAATFIFALLSIPLAYLLVKKEFFGKKIILGILNLPVVIPHSAAGIALLGFISRDTFLGKFAEFLGFSLVGNPIGISLAMAYVSVPFLINSARHGFYAVPDRLEKTALCLGASSIKVFFTISLPLSARYIISGFILMFARGMSEFGAVIIIAYHPMTTPVMIFERFNSYGLSYSRPVAIVFIIICLLIFTLMRLFVKERQDVRN